MAYLTGMILGNGEIQRGTRETTITIDIPYKNLYTNAKQQKAFELYRSSFNNLTIITFDELHQKICDLMSVFKEDSPRPVDSLMDEFSIIDEDYPI